MTTGWSRSELNSPASKAMLTMISSIAPRALMLVPIAKYAATIEQSRRAGNRKAVDDASDHGAGERRHTHGAAGQKEVVDRAL